MPRRKKIISPPKKRKIFNRANTWKICMVSDFFYPNMGGIEEHVYNLSMCLMERGHKVIVVTHHYGERKGVRVMTRGLKVYYVPARVFYNGSILPTLVSLIPLLREILVREEINIVHGHGAFSSLAHDALFLAKVMDVKTVFTDHSLFGFADASSILTNRFLEISLCDVDEVICVSHVGKANTATRSRSNGWNISVIPNAVDIDRFRPITIDEPRPPSDRVIIVTLCRLVYRKGVDLLAAIIPIMMESYEFVDFYVGGDGPLTLPLEELREAHGNRVQLFGALDHSQVREFLVKGHIFLNTSITEAFCMAIVEAAACGLQVVSTHVGGIPEVLPPELVLLAEPKVPDMMYALHLAVTRRVTGNLPDPTIAHGRVGYMYNWRDVAARTEVVYDRAIATPSMEPGKRIERYLKIGWLIGPLFFLVYGLGLLIFRILNYLHPIEEIEIPPTLDYHEILAWETQKLMKIQRQYEDMARYKSNTRRADTLKWCETHF